MTEHDENPGSAEQRRSAARETARREAFRLARDTGAPIVQRPMYSRDNEPSVRDVEPLAGARAARDLETAAEGTARDYIRQAREAGHGWDQIGDALGLTPGRDPGHEGATAADAAYAYAACSSGHRSTLAAQILHLDLSVLRSAHHRPGPDPRTRRRRTRPRPRVLPAR